MSQTVQLKDVADLLRGVSYPKDRSSKKLLDGYNPIYRANNINGTINDDDLVYVDAKLIKEYQYIQKGDILIAMSSGSKQLVGKTAQSKEDKRIAFGAFCGVIRPRGNINSEYLGYFFQTQSYRNLISTVSKGIGINNLRRSYLEDIVIQIHPLNEQEKIVAKIEELFSEIDNATAVNPKTTALLARYKLAILASAYTGKSSVNRPFEAGENIIVDDELVKKLPKLPGSWRYAKLKGLGELARGKSKHRPRNDQRLFGGPYPFLQTGEVKASGGLITKYEKTYSEFGLTQSKLWPKGTLCITIAANIAETAFLNFDACFPDSVVGFTANPEFVLPKYVKYFIELSKEKIERFAPATAQKNINLKTLEELVIPLCSLHEQQEIIDVIESKFSEANNLADVILTVNLQGQSAKQSILSKAFKGELV